MHWLKSHLVWIALALCAGCAAPYPRVPRQEFARRILPPMPPPQEPPEDAAAPEVPPPPAELFTPGPEARNQRSAGRRRVTQASFSTQHRESATRTVQQPPS